MRILDFNRMPDKKVIFPICTAKKKCSGGLTAKIQ